MRSKTEDGSRPFGIHRELVSRQDASFDVGQKVVAAQGAPSHDSSVGIAASKSSVIAVRDNIRSFR